MEESKSKKYFWLKLKRDFFKRHDITILEAMPNGKEYSLFYLKLMLESIDHEGRLRFNDQIPYNETMLAAITNTNIDIVRSAIKVLEQLGLLEILDDATIYMTEVDNMMGFETAWAEQKRKQRMLPTLNNGSKRLNGELIRLPNGATRYVDEKRYGGNGMYVLDRAKGKCEICGSSENVVIHHNNGNSNEPEDLICLCSKCHGIAHSNKYGGHIPPIVHTESDKRLELEIELDKRKDSVYNTMEKKEPIASDFSACDLDEMTLKLKKHKYGKYKNILLTDEEYEKLANRQDGLNAIEYLSEYREYKGYKAKSDYLAILKWVFNAMKEEKIKQERINNAEVKKTRFTDIKSNEQYDENGEIIIPDEHMFRTKKEQEELRKKDPNICFDIYGRILGSDEIEI